MNLEDKNVYSVYIKTLGCQMNVYDTSLITGLLEDNGFVMVDDFKQADIIIFNTCSVRDLAEKKVFSQIGQVYKLRKKEDVVIGVCGCMAQNLKDEIFKKTPYVDFVCGTQEINSIPAAVQECLVKKGNILKVGAGSLFPDYNRRKGEKSLLSSVAVMRGCENFCTYCIVPYVRGKEVSRPVSEITDEIKMLVDNGMVEVMLLGQNVNSYGAGMDDDISFVNLLEKVNEIDGLKRIRFVTSHPKDAHEELFYAIRDLEKVCEFLHMPVQAGSNAILKLMNRGYTREQYLEKIEIARSIVPNLAFSTDIIVGFPYEDEEDFQDTLDIMRTVKYDSAFMFKYSIRSRTKAALMPKQIEKAVKEDRHARLLKVQDAIASELNLAEIGTCQEILVEGVSKKNTERLYGRTRKNKIVVFAGEASLIGQLVTLKIINATAHTLYGEFV